jgi:hypothetical protein
VYGLRSSCWEKVFETGRYGSTVTVKAFNDPRIRDSIQNMSHIYCFNSRKESGCYSDIINPLSF